MNEKTCYNRMKGLIIGLLVMLVGFFVVGLAGHEAKAIDVNADLFLPLMVDEEGSGVTIDNSKLIEGTSSPTYVAQQYAYIKDNVLTFDVQLKVNCMGSTTELAVEGLDELLGASWKKEAIIFLYQNYGLSMDSDGKGGYSVGQSTVTALQGMDDGIYNQIITSIRPDVTISDLQKKSVKNVILGILSKMADSGSYYSLDNLPASVEKYIYYCTSADAYDLYTTDFDKTFGNIEGYYLGDKYAGIIDNNRSSQKVYISNLADAGYIVSYTHIFTAYQFEISEVLNKTKENIKNELIFPAYLDLYNYIKAVNNTNNHSSTNLNTIRNKHIVPAGNRTQAAFCNNWYEGRIGKQYVGICLGQYKVTTETSEEIFNYKLKDLFINPSAMNNLFNSTTNLGPNLFVGTRIKTNWEDYLAGAYQVVANDSFVYNFKRSFALDELTLFCSSIDERCPNLAIVKENNDLLNNKALEPGPSSIELSFNFNSKYVNFGFSIKEEESALTTKRMELYDVKKLGGFDAENFLLSATDYSSVGRNLTFTETMGEDNKYWQQLLSGKINTEIINGLDELMQQLEVLLAQNTNHSANSEKYNGISAFFMMINQMMQDFDSDRKDTASQLSGELTPLFRGILQDMVDVSMDLKNGLKTTSNVLFIIAGVIFALTLALTITATAALAGTMLAISFFAAAAAPVPVVGWIIAGVVAIAAGIFALCAKSKYEHEKDEEREKIASMPLDEMLSGGDYLTNTLVIMLPIFQYVFDYLTVTLWGNGKLNPNESVNFPSYDLVKSIIREALTRRKRSFEYGTDKFHMDLAGTMLGVVDDNNIPNDTWENYSKKDKMAVAKIFHDTIAKILESETIIDAMASPMYQMIIESSVLMVDYSSLRNCLMYKVDGTSTYDYFCYNNYKNSESEKYYEYKDINNSSNNERYTFTEEAVRRDGKDVTDIWITIGESRYRLGDTIVYVPVNLYTYFEILQTNKYPLMFNNGEKPISSTQWHKLRFYAKVVYETYGKYYSPTSGRVQNRTGAELAQIYSVMVGTAKSKGSQSYQTAINIIKDNGSPNFTLIKDNINDEVYDTEVVQMDTSLFITESNFSDVDAGTTKNKILFKNSDTAKRYKKIVLNSAYTFSFFSSGEWANFDPKIRYRTIRGVNLLDSMILGSGVDHYEYMILKNSDKDGEGTLGEFNYMMPYSIEKNKFIEKKYNALTVTTAFIPNTYYTYDDIENEYLLLEQKPEDWDENYSNYYSALPITHIDSDGNAFLTYITDSTSSAFIESNFYWQILSTDSQSLTISEDGEYLIIVRAVDFSGNRGSISYKHILIDTVAPKMSLDFITGKDSSGNEIVAQDANSQFVNMLANIEEGKSPYMFVASKSLLSHINISIDESYKYSSGLGLTKFGSISGFKVCASYLDFDSRDANADKGCLDLETELKTKEKVGSNDQGKRVSVSGNGYLNWRTGGSYVLGLSSGAYRPNGYVNLIDIAGVGDNINLNQNGIIRIAIELTDLAGNVNLIRFLVIQDIENLDIKYQISTDIKYNLLNEDNPIERLEIDILYNRIMIGDLVYDHTSNTNLIKSNYFDLNDKNIMTYKYIVISEADREAFIDENGKPNNTKLVDRFIQENPSDDIRILIEDLNLSTENYYIFTHYELKIGGVNRDYSYIRMQEFEYSTNDLNKQLQFAKDEYGLKVGSIVNDGTTTNKSSEKYQMRLVFTDFSERKNGSEFGSYFDNLIDYFDISFDVYRQGLVNPSASVEHKEYRLNTHTDFAESKKSTIDYIENWVERRKTDKGQDVYYIYIDFKKYAEEFSYLPTFSVNNIKLMATKTINKPIVDDENKALVSHYDLLSLSGTGFTIYTNYTTGEDANAKPSVGSFEFTPEMNIQIMKNNMYSNAQKLEFLIRNGSASLNYIFDTTLIYQFVAFENNLSLLDQAALVADYYNIDLYYEFIGRAINKAERDNDSIRKTELLRLKNLLLSQYIDTLTPLQLSKLYRYMDKNTEITSLADVTMQHLKSLNCYSLKYQTILTDYLKNLSTGSGMYSYLYQGKADSVSAVIDIAFQKVLIDKVDPAMRDTQVEEYLEREAFRIKAGMVGWKNISFDSNNKVTAIANGSNFISNFKNGDYVIVYRVVDVLNRTDMAFIKVRFYNNLPTFSPDDDVIDLTNSVFDAGLTDVTLNEYLELKYKAIIADYTEFIKENPNMCVVLDNDCVTLTRDIAMNDILVGNTYQVRWSVEDIATNKQTFTVNYKVVYEIDPKVNLYYNKDYTKALDQFEIAVNFNAIGGMSVAEGGITLFKCVGECLENLHYANGTITVTELGNQKVYTVADMETETLYDSLMVAGAVEVPLFVNSSNIATIKEGRIAENGIYIVRVIINNGANHTAKACYSKFIIDNIDLDAPNLYIVHSENDVEFINRTGNTLLAGSNITNLDDYYFTNEVIFLKVHDKLSGTSSSSEKVKVVLNNICNIVNSDEECLRSVFTSSDSIPVAGRYTNKIWTFDLSPSIVDNRIGRQVYYVKAEDALGNVTYRKLTVQVDRVKPTIDGINTKIVNATDDIYVDSASLHIRFTAGINIGEGFDVASPYDYILINETGNNYDPTETAHQNLYECTSIRCPDDLYYNLALDPVTGVYANGMRNIYIRLYDKAGNKSEALVMKVFLDNDLPAIEVKINNEAEITNQGKTVVVNALDNTSNIYDGSFMDNKGETHYGLAYKNINNSLWIQIKDNDTVFISENGKYEFRVYDKSKNMAQTFIEITTIDKAAPAVTFAPNGNSEKLPTHSVTFTIIEDLSYIKDVTYCWLQIDQTAVCNESSSMYYTVNIVDEERVEYIGVSSRTSSELSQDGKYILAVTVSDKFGNTATYRSKVFEFDCKMPDISIGVKDKAKLIENANFVLTSSLDGSNIKASSVYEYEIKLIDSKDITAEQVLLEKADVYIAGNNMGFIKGTWVKATCGTNENINNCFVENDGPKITYSDAIVTDNFYYYLKFASVYTNVEGLEQEEVVILRIKITDANDPVIKLVGPAEVEYVVKTIAEYDPLNPGVTATDVVDGDITFVTTGAEAERTGIVEIAYTVDGSLPTGNDAWSLTSIDTSKVGTYFIRYIVRDNAAHTASVIRKVIFIDNVAPVISFKDSLDVDNFLVGNDFDYLYGLSISDNFDGEIVKDFRVENSKEELPVAAVRISIKYYTYSEFAKDFVLVGNGNGTTKIEFNADKVGPHKFEYSYDDSNGNTTTVTRIITVKDVVATYTEITEDNGQPKSFDLTNKREGIVSGEIEIDPNGLNLAINGINYESAVKISSVGKYKIVVTDNYGNEAEYSIYMDTQNANKLLVDKTMVEVEDTIIRSISKDQTYINLTEEFTDGVLSTYSPDDLNKYVAVIAIFCNDLDDTKGVACSNNYLELSVMENLTDTNSVISLSSLANSNYILNLEDVEVKRILEQTQGSKIALLIMEKEESEAIAQAKVAPVNKAAKNIPLYLLIGIPLILGLYVLFRIIKFRKGVKAI